MKTVSDLLQLCDQLAPFDTACSFDNCGLLVGDPTLPCTCVGVALDVTPHILAKAKQAGCDVIITHHPVIFDPLKALATDSMPYQLATAGIACIAMHTNLDKSSAGTNHQIATHIGLQDITSPAQADDLVRLGHLPTPTAIEAVVDHLKTTFDAPRIRFYDAGRAVHRVVSVAGSGGDALELAVALGADTLITGDLKHDRFITAQCKGLNLIELCHQDSEVMVLPSLTATLQQAGYRAVLLPPAPIQAR